MYELGLIYLYGYKVGQNITQGLYYISKSADAGIVEAHDKLVSYYQAWIKEASQGDAIAQFNLGAAFENGVLRSDYPYAYYDLYKRAALQNNAEAIGKVTQVEAMYTIPSHILSGPSEFGYKIYIRGQSTLFLPDPSLQSAPSFLPPPQSQYNPIPLPSPVFMSYQPFTPPPSVLPTPPPTYPLPLSSTALNLTQIDSLQKQVKSLQNKMDLIQDQNSKNENKANAKLKLLKGTLTTLSNIVTKQSNDLKLLAEKYNVALTSSSPNPNSSQSAAAVASPSVLPTASLTAASLAAGSNPSPKAARKLADIALEVDSATENENENRANKKAKTVAVTDQIQVL